MATEIQYVALKPLLVDNGDGGGLVRLKPGDPIVNPEGWRRSLTANIEAGNIAALPVPTLADISDEDFDVEAFRRGYKKR